MDRHSFHPLITRWFCEKFGEPSAPQDAGWPEIATGRDTLIAAPTGTGKTLAAFLWSLDSLIRDALAGELEDACRLVYISPLKALGNDIQKNLQEPLSEIRALAREEGVELPEIRVAVRSGDTPGARAQAHAQEAPPHPHHHARIALHSPDGRAQPQGFGDRARRHRGRDSRGRRATSGARTWRSL